MVRIVPSGTSRRSVVHAALIASADQHEAERSPELAALFEQSLTAY